MTYNPNGSGVGYASYGTPQDQALRLAQAQLAEGASTAPIRAKSQGVARLADALMGGLAQRQAMQGWQQGQQDRMAATQGGGAAMPGGAGLPAAPGALADLTNSIGPVPNLTDATFNGLTDADIMGPGPQQGPPPAAMAPNNSAVGPAMTAQASSPSVQLANALTGGQGPQIDPTTGLPMGGVNVASNDPNFAPGPQAGFQAPSAVSQPSTGNANGNGSGAALVAMQQAHDAPQGSGVGGSAIASPPPAGGQFNPADLAMFQQDMQAVPGGQPPVGQGPQGGAPGAQSGGGTLDQLKANIAGTESRGQPNSGYGAIGPVTASGDRALGKYQVMGANVPSWTQAALGQAMTPQQFLASPEAQEATVNHRLGGYLNQYGPEGAARAWFTGSPVGNAADVNGMTGDRYAALATQGMTPGQSSFLNSSVAGPGAPSNIGGPSAQPTSLSPSDDDASMFQKDMQAVPGGGQGNLAAGGQPQPGSGVNMDAVRRILMNPYADPATRSWAEQMLTPNWQTISRPDGSVVAYDTRNPSNMKMIAAPVKASTFTQIGTDGSGNPRYGFVNPASGTVTPADTQGGGAPASPYVPRTVGAPQPAGQPAPQGNGESQNAPAPGGNQPIVSGQPSNKPNTIASPDYTVKRTPSEDALDAMAAADPNPANAQLYTRARNILLGNEPAPLIGVAGTKPVDVATMNVVRQAAQNAGTDFNPAVATMRANNIKGWMDTVTPSSQGGQLYAANGSLEHLGTLKSASDDLGASQTNMQGVNAAQGWLANNFPYIPDAGTDVAAKRAAYATALGPVADEVTKLYSGGPGTEAGRDKIIADLGPDAPQPARDAAMKTIATLLNGKVSALGNQWTQAGFAAPFPALSPQGQSTLDRLIGPQPGQQGAPPIPPAAIQRLRQNPGLASDFEQKYGLPPGSSHQYLGQ